VYVLDSSGQPVPAGVIGEIHVGGVGVTRGYLGRPDLTAEKFVPDPFGGGQGYRLYRTGDLARYLDDGRIEFIGRRDEQVKIRGFRIELGEIEARLKEHTAIKDAAVLARDDGAERQIVAYILRATEGGPTVEELNDFLGTSLPSYMIPAAYVTLDTFPLLPSGKTDRKSLPPPGLDRPVLEAEYAGPRDEVELALVRIWEETLHRKPVGIRDNFFLLGGNSLLALRLLGQVQREFRRSVPLVTLFQHPTVEHQASLLQEIREQATDSMLVELRKGGSLPPLYLVHPTGGSVHWYTDLARHLDANRPILGIQSRQTPPADESIEGMAARYVHAILAHQPDGPYHIAGWSFGVIVAFEIGQQLKALGREVAFLAVLDQGPYVPTREEPKDLAELLTVIFEDHFHLDTGYLRQLTEDEQFRFVLRKAKKLGLFPFFIRLQDFRQYILTNKAQTGAWRRYQIKSFPGRITLVRAREGDGDHTSLADFGWGPFAQAGVEVLEVPGDHISMMQQPNVRVLAQSLSDCLRAVNGVGDHDGAS
jgi:thioesterase domain-containing protein